MLRHISSLLLITALLLTACNPYRDDEIDLGPAPGAPDFTVQFLPGDSNRIIVTDRTPGVFLRLWDLPGADPKVSTAASDTVFYAKAGEYVVTLHLSKEDGSGTASGTRNVTIANDGAVQCTPKLALLTGDCGPDGKCWTLRRTAGAVTVGPTYGSPEWYSSPADGLAPEQYDDSFCFYFTNQEFRYENNAATVNPWAGYAAVPYDPPVGDWTFSEGTGPGGVDQIVLSEPHFLGVWDSDNALDVIVLTADRLIVRARQRDQAGNPLPQGWFELHFEPR